MPSNKNKRGNKKNKKRNDKTSYSSSVAATAAIEGNGDGTARIATAALPPPQQQQKQRWTEETFRTQIGEDVGLNDFPMSKYFVIAWNLRSDLKHDETEEACARGIDIDSCVWCIYFYAELEFDDRCNLHRAFPWYLECAIRGHLFSMKRLCEYYYSKSHYSTSQTEFGLRNFWTKIVVDLDQDQITNFTQNDRETKRDDHRSICAYCRTSNLPEKHLCEGFRCYSYCSKECQRLDWKVRNHRGECRQLTILKHNYKNHVKEIRNEIVRGVDPKSIVPIQRVRSKLGLNQPKENYEDLFRYLDSYDITTDVSNNGPNPFEYFSGRAVDGTVHIGSAPCTI